MPTSSHSINSSEIQDIIGQIPPWTVRWGITVLSVVFLIIFFCSFHIKYPDTLPANVIISSRDQPFQVSWYRNGPHVHKLYVQENQEVQAGDTLVVEQNLVDSTLTPSLSPVSGRVIFIKGAENNPRKSTIIVYPRLTSYDVQLYLPPQGFGKVHTQQRVLIELDAYPAQDFGTIEGNIRQVLPVPVDNKYRAQVQLLQGMVTSEQKPIPPQHSYTGNAEIILENRSLFSRVFGSLFSFK